MKGIDTAFSQQIFSVFQKQNTKICIFAVDYAGTAVCLLRN